MGLKSWRRREAIETPEDDEAIIGEEHAWWAERDRLERVFVASPTDTSATTKDPLSEFWSPESLFRYDQRPADGTDEEDALPDPYGVLGLPTYATWPEVTAAHRRLAKQCHPDMMVGAPQEERDAAEERMRTVNRAYNQLRRAREASANAGAGIQN